MALFCLEKCLKKTLECSGVALFLLFFIVSMCVCSFTWPAEFNHLLILTHRPKDASNILSKVSPHNLASHHHHHRDIKRTRRALTLFRERV